MKFLRRVTLATNILFALALLLSVVSPLIDPMDSVIPAFFGLAFLPLFAINLLFLILWSIWKFAHALYSGLVLIIALGSFSDHIHYAFTTDESKPEDLKVLTFNVRLFDLYNWKSNTITRDSIIGFLIEEEADIMCMQEFFKSRENEKTRKRYFNTLDTLIEVQDAKFLHEAYSAILHNGRDHFGTATLTNYRIYNRQRVELKTSGHNSAIATDIIVQDDTIRIYNVHLASLKISGYEDDIKQDAEQQNQMRQMRNMRDILRMMSNAFRRRSMQVKAVKEHLDQSPYPVILCGDFNDTPGSYAYRQLSENLEDAFKVYGRGIGNSYIGFFPSFRIDYILYSPELEVTSFETVNIHLSDHKPITATFRLAEQGAE